LPAGDEGRETGAPGSVATQPSDGADGDRQEAALALPEEAGPRGFDETAESAFRAEAHGRGESVPRSVAAATIEPKDSTPLPPLDELVRQIPGDVREALDELFRAKFTAVRRIPRQALEARPQ
jgi:hypothetical protein